jgi:transposase
MKPAASAIGLRRSVLAEIERIRVIEGVDLSAEILPVLDICESIRIHLKDVDRGLKKRAAEIPQCRRFLEIPGVGFLTALSFYSAVEDPHRFPTAQDIGAYFGLAPSVEASGTSRRDGGISRMGNKLTRTHLVTAASVMLNLKLADCAMYDWAHSLAGRIGRGRARVALARKLAVVMLSMWRSGEPYQAPGNLRAGPETTAEAEPQLADCPPVISACESHILPCERSGPVCVQVSRF